MKNRDEVNVMQMPSLSVVFPNYNHARFLPMQLGSMISQSFRPKEIIIIDDASTDNSVEVIREFMRQEPRIQLICNERNMGVEWNINRLIEIASGDYLYLSAADDMILPGFFEKSMALLAQHPEAGLCSAVGRLIDEEGKDRGIRALPVISNEPCFLSPDQVRKKLCKYGRWFAISSMIIKRDAILCEGGQNTALGSFADNFLALVIALRHGACFIPEPFSCWRQMASGHGTASNADWENLMRQGKLVCESMRTKYEDLFPSDYVDHFERHWMYMVSRNAGQKMFTEFEQTLQKMLARFFCTSNFMDRTFCAGIRLLIRFQPMAWRLYSIAKFAPWRWWILGRLSIMLNLRKIVIKEKQEV